MATTTKQDKDFADAVVEPSHLLEKAIDWIGGNLSPSDVFSDSDLETWAKEQGVEDVCSLADLETWAEENGYVKEEE